MITEDYISFEVAKLLKKKGFNISPDSKNWMCCMYDENENIYWGIYDKNWYFRITHQMAMSWLREEYKINIEIHYNRFGENYKYLIIYKPEILDDIRSLGVFYHYEDAVEEAIKYSLENLI